MVSLVSQYTLKSSVIFPDVPVRNVHELAGGLFLLNSVVSYSHSRSFCCFGLGLFGGVGLLVWFDLVLLLLLWPGHHCQDKIFWLSFIEQKFLRY